MKKYIKLFMIICSLIMFFNCNQIKNNKESKEVKGVTEVQFIDENFHIILDEFINKIDIYSVNKFDSILIQLYTSDTTSDTLLLLHNFPPIDKYNFVFATNYKEYKLYFYSPDILKDKLYKLVNSSDVEKDLVLFKLLDNEEFDVTYQAIYVINNDSIFPLKIPLEVK